MRVWGFGLFIVLAATPALAGEIVAAGAVSAVTVFADRAAVTRTVSVDLPAGDSAIVLDGLPGRLLPESLRIEAAPAQPVAIGSIESRRVNLPDLAQQRERELVAALADRRARRKLVEAEGQALAIRKGFIEAIGRSAGGQVDRELLQGQLQPELWQKAWTTLQTGAEETLRGIVATEAEQRRIDDDIRRLEADLDAVRTGRRDRTQLRVNLAADRPGPFSFAVTYQVPDAGWQPLYEARLDTDAGGLVLSQFGGVRQRTGEDWSGVRLTLSTARPAAGTAMPELPPWWVEFLDPARARPMALPAPAAPQSAAKEERQREDRPAAMIEATTVATEFAAEFRIPGLATVPADSATHKLAIATHKLAAQLSVRTTPKLDPRAYLFAQAPFAGTAPLLPGGVALFRDGAFIGNGRLPLLRPDERLELSFGVDDKIRVERVTLGGETSQQGVINRDRRIERKFRTEIENLHRRPMRITVYDQIPVSRDEALKVELLRRETTPDFALGVDDRPGVLAWEAIYKPAEKRRIDLGYALIFPQDRAVSGF